MQRVIWCLCGILRFCEIADGGAVTSPASYRGDVQQRLRDKIEVRWQQQYTVSFAMMMLEAIKVEWPSVECCVRELTSYCRCMQVTVLLVLVQVLEKENDDTIVWVQPVSWPLISSDAKWPCVCLASLAAGSRIEQKPVCAMECWSDRE